LLHSILLFLLLSLSASVYATSSELVVSNQEDSFKRFSLDFFEDKSAQLSFDEIRQRTDFITSPNHLSEGYSASTFWVKFKVSNQSDSSVNYFIQYTENSIHTINFHTLSSDGSYTTEKKGINYLSSNMAIKPAKFQLHLSAGETKTVYLSNSTFFPVNWAIYVLNTQSLNNYFASYNSYYAFFFGTLFSLMVYNAFIFAYTKDASYLNYVIYSGLFLSWQAIINNFLPVNTISSPNLYYLAIGIIIPLLVATFINFSRSLLDTRSLLPKIDRSLQGLFYFFLLLCFLSIIDLRVTFTIVTALVPLVLPFLIFVAIKCFNKGSKPAIFYIVAQFSFISLATLYSLMSVGVLPYTLINRHGIIVGAVIEISLFSLALAYKIKSLQNEKVFIINNQNIELEKKVKERTLELKELANQDPLTSLHNRRFLYEISEKLILLARREKTPLSLIMFDLDHFKRINDDYGHSLGDEVIKIFAQKIQQTRESDISARIGGEEFVLLLPNTNEQGAYEIASQLRTEVEKTSILSNDNTPIHFTVSSGISVLSETDNTIDQLLNRADKALYMAKDLGRNKVMIANTTNV